MSKQMFSTLKECLLAQPHDLIEYFNDVATEKGRYSWLLQPKVNNGVCFVAHIDTIFEDRFSIKDIYADPKNEKIWYSPQGIGGDDRCGVYASLKLSRILFEDEAEPILLFTDGEERGCIGATEATKLYPQLKNVKFFVGLDRRNTDDMVFYNDEPKEFRDFIKTYGFKEATGTCSDVAILGSHFKKCAVNLSVGYKNEHTLYETINIDALHDTINRVQKLCYDMAFEEKVWENNKGYVWQPETAIDKPEKEVYNIVELKKKPKWYEKLFKSMRDNQKDEWGY